jgi:hypothetical protein
MDTVHRVTLAGLVALAAPLAGAQQTQVYKCPGPPVLYTDQLSPQEAREKGCTTIEGAPVTVIQSPKVRAPTPAPAAVGTRVDPADQRARDNDARRILADELRREEDRLVQLQKDYNNGEPERRGDERNYQKYIDRVADMKAAITRKEADIAALKREIAKLPQ